MSYKSRLYVAYQVLLISGIIFIQACGAQKLPPPPPPPPPPSNSSGMLLQKLMKNAWSTTQLMGLSMDVENPNVESPSIKFESGGRMTGTTGCNAFMGTYSVSGDQVKLDPGAMTKKACGGEQEQKFLEVLRRTVNLRLSGDRIDLVDEKEEVLAQLKPKKQ